MAKPGYLVVFLNELIQRLDDDRHTCEVFAKAADIQSVKRQHKEDLAFYEAAIAIVENIRHFFSSNDTNALKHAQALAEKYIEQVPPSIETSGNIIDEIIEDVLEDK